MRRYPLDTFPHLPIHLILGDNVIQTLTLFAIIALMAIATGCAIIYITNTKDKD